MKKLIQIAVLCSTLGFCLCCSSYLDLQPQGTITSDQLNTPTNVEKMVIAAYSDLGNDNIHTSYSLWPWGSMRSGDAYKGGDSPGDNTEWHSYETFVTNTVDNGTTNEMWGQVYAAIGRVNDALRRVNAIGEDQLSTKKQRQAEMRFVRAHFYFLLKVLYKYVPYIDETTPTSSYQSISNRALTNDQLWTKIADDFRAAADILPETQSDKGRPTKWAAKAYLAKTLLYQAYQQDENHVVTAIDAAKLQEVVSLSDQVINAGRYQLQPDFANNFLSQYRNGVESIFAIQFSKNDGTPFGRLDMGHALNYPMNQEFGCCWFHIPSQNLINAFKTDATGLPQFTTYNNTDVQVSTDFQTNTFDPRLDHTVAIPNHPWKYKPNFVYRTTWARAPQIYGPYTSLKESVAPDDPSFQKNPPFMSSSKNWDIIRLADVLLWKAEALIELDRPNEALPLINQLRQRAANSTALLKQADGSYSSTYKMGVYPGTSWTQPAARQALQWERRLEFAMEGYRFFDLVRWGIAADYLNAYFAVESKKRQHLIGATFKKSRDEYLPIPLNQFNYSAGLYKQNTGW